MKAAGLKYVLVEGEGFCPLFLLLCACGSQSVVLFTCEFVVNGVARRTQKHPQKFLVKAAWEDDAIVVCNIALPDSCFSWNPPFRAPSALLSESIFIPSSFDFCSCLNPSCILLFFPWLFLPVLLLVFVRIHHSHYFILSDSSDAYFHQIPYFSLPLQPP